MSETVAPLFGRSPAVAQLLVDCECFAPTRYPLLLLGPRGSGKTMLARHIHGLSGRRGALVAESAAGIPEHLEHSQLGGHARGSFTGAHADRMGLIEAAHQGTFFLDELGVASARVQEILLELLDEGTLRRVGEVRARPVDVRFIAATNADLPAMVRAGTFREDLLDRFGYLVLRLPPLAERRDEILPLAEAFVRREAAALGFPSPMLTPEARSCLQLAPWHGNIRELQAVLRYALLQSLPRLVITPTTFPTQFLAALPRTRNRHKRPTPERERVEEALAKTGGDKSAAARELGISRQTLYRLLAEWSDAYRIAG